MDAIKLLGGLLGGRGQSGGLGRQILQQVLTKSLWGAATVSLAAGKLG